MSRARALAGCGNAGCKDKTLFVSFSLAGLGAADGVDISVSVGGGTPKVSHVSLPNGVAKPSVQIAFPNGFPSGQSVTVEVDVKAAAVLVGSGSSTVPLTGKCAAVSVALTPAAVANKHQGDACGPDDICDTGNCVDGFCCDSPFRQQSSFAAPLATDIAMRWEVAPRSPAARAPMDSRAVAAAAIRRAAATARRRERLPRRQRQPRRRPRRLPASNVRASGQLRSGGAGGRRAGNPDERCVPVGFPDRRA